MINRLRGTFDNKIVKKFAKKKIEVTFQEEHIGSALRTLSIVHVQKDLIAQQLKDTVIVEADFPSGEHSKYSTFIKSNAFFLTKQCDFFIIHQKDDQLYIAICDMKSSKGGDDERCKQQIEHAQLFLTYIVKSAICSEKYKPLASKEITDYKFIKLLFIPESTLGISLSAPIDMSCTSSEPKFKTDGTTNFHTLEMNGNSAREQWTSIVQRFPNI